MGVIVRSRVKVPLELQPVFRARVVIGRMRATLGAHSYLDLQTPG